MDRVLQNLPAAAVGVIGAVLLAWAALRMWPRGARRLCPGPRRRWDWVLPWRWVLVRPACGYELDGLRLDEHGGVTCPECGRVTSGARQRLRVVRRVRVWPVGTAVVMLAWWMWRADELRRWAWVRWVPAGLAVQVDHVLGNRTPPAIRYLVMDELTSGRLSPRQADTVIATLIRDLKDDDVEWNAMSAMSWLRSLRLGAVPTLERALRSPDYQTRQLAASVLREDEWVQPSHDLLLVTIEGLRSDDLPSQPASNGRRPAYSYVSNAREGVAYLSKHAGKAAIEIRRAMEGGDEQQRLLCAVAAGLAGIEELLPAAAPILLERLKGNRVSSDATLAQAALVGFGPCVIEFLAPAMDTGDAQQQLLVRRVLERVRKNAYSAAKAMERGETWEPARLELGDVYMGDLER